MVVMLHASKYRLYDLQPELLLRNADMQETQLQLEESPPIDGELANRTIPFFP